MKLLSENFNNNFGTLVVDGEDGLHFISFANHGSKVAMCEPNEILNGGCIDDIPI